MVSVPCPGKSSPELPPSADRRAVIGQIERASGECHARGSGSQAREFPSSSVPAAMVVPPL